MDSKTYLKNLRESPKKLRFFLSELKKRKPAMALDYLYYAPQKAAKVLYQALKSAIANAKNSLKVDENLLEWKLLLIEEGYKLKRYRPGGRGTPKPFKIRFSHIKIVLGAKSSEQIQKKPSFSRVTRDSEGKEKVEGIKKIEGMKAENKKVEDKRVYDVKDKKEKIQVIKTNK